MESNVYCLQDKGILGTAKEDELVLSHISYSLLTYLKRIHFACSSRRVDTIPYTYES